MERDAWNKQNGQKRFQGMGFPVKKPNEYACIALKSLFCTIGWSLFLSVQLSVQNFPTESFIAPTAILSASTPSSLPLVHTPEGFRSVEYLPSIYHGVNSRLLRSR